MNRQERRRGAMRVEGTHLGPEGMRLKEALKDDLLEGEEKMYVIPSGLKAVAMEGEQPFVEVAVEKQFAEYLMKMAMLGKKLDMKIVVVTPYVPPGGMVPTEGEG